MDFPTHLKVSMPVIKGFEKQILEDGRLSINSWLWQLLSIFASCADTANGSDGVFAVRWSSCIMQR
jgi:hypothetical protein